MGGEYQNSMFREVIYYFVFIYHICSKIYPKEIEE